MNKIITLTDAEKYLTLKYVEGKFDCGSLAVLVQKELFGRDIEIPHAAERARGARGQALDIDKYQKSLAQLVAEPATGDAVVMWTSTETGTPPYNRRWHVGTAFIHNKEVWVLHCANEKRGVALQKLSHLKSNGVHIDAFYEWTEPKKLQLSIFPRPLSGDVQIHLVPHGTTLLDALRAKGIEGQRWTVRLDGIAVPYALWARTRVRHGVLIEARAQSKKQILSVVALLVLAYFTFGTGTLFIGAGATIGGGFIAAAAVYIGGAMLINKFLGPKPASMGGLGDSTQAPPTYSLSNPRNRARLWEPLAMVIGETKMVPDNANQPFVWYEGSDQFLSAQFHAGINCFDVTDIKIGATPISNYEDVTIRRYGFPENNSGVLPSVGSSVDTVDGGLVDWPIADVAPTPLVRTTSAGTVRIELDFEGTVQNMDDKGKWVSKSLTITLKYRPVGSSGDSGWLSLGAGFYTITNMGPKPVRITLPFEVDSGNYEISVSKGEKNSSATDAEERMQNDIALVRIKSYQQDFADYGGQPRIEIRIKASGQLSGSLDEINWIAAARPMDYWNGSAWSTVTAPGADGISNPGAIILMLLRGIYRPSDGKRIAGVGFSDDRIDLESLKGFMVRCATKGYRFDFVVQQAMNAQTLLETVASSGMGTLTRQNNGRIGVVWFAEDQPIEGVINMAAMRSGDGKDGPATTIASNFTVQYDLVRTADEFQLEFFDRDNDWTWQPMRVIAPGVDVPQRTSSENVQGVTTMPHAATLARFAMAQNLYGRKTISFEMDMDYLDYKRGAVVALSHDLTQWGYGGRLFSFTAGAGSFTLELDDPVPPAGVSIGLRLPGERQMRTFPVGTVSADGLTVTVFQAWPGATPAPGTNTAAHDTLWIYDFKATPGYRVRIMSIEPGSNSDKASVTCVPESPEFWQYVETGVYIPPPNNSDLVVDLPVATNLKVTRGRILQSGSWVHQLTAAFDVRGAYDHAQLWAAPVGTPLTLVDSQVFGTQVSWIVQADQTWSVEIRPFDALGRMGTKVSQVYADPSDAVDGVTALSASVAENGVLIRWAAPQGVASIGWALTQIKIGLLGSTWDTANLVYEGRTDSCNIGWIEAHEYLVWARHKNDAGDFSTPISVPFTIAVPAQPVVVDDTFFAQVQLDWQNCRTSQPIKNYEIKIGPIYAEAEFKTRVLAQTFVFIPPTAGVYRYWVTAIDVAENRGAPGSVEVETTEQLDAAMQELQDGLDAQAQDIIDLGNALTAEALARGSAITEVQNLIIEGDEQLAEMITTITARAGNGSNLLENSEFAADVSGWTLTWDTAAPMTLTKAGDAFTVGDGTAAITEASGPDATSTHRGLAKATKPIPVIPGKRYQASAFTSAQHCKMDLLVIYTDTAGATVGLSSLSAESLDGDATGGKELADYKRIGVFTEAPAGSAFAQMAIRKFTTNVGQTSSVGYFARPMFLSAATSQTEFDEYSPAGVGAALTAAVQVVANAVADLEGTLSATYSLVITAGNHVAGWKAAIDGTASSLVFLFDKVAFAINDADGSPKQLMTLGNVAGSPSVGISGNLYLDGFLIARHIQADQIGANHIKTNAIEARHVKANSITVDKLAVGVSGNLLLNSELVSTRGWGFYDGTAGEAQNANTGLNKPDSAYQLTRGNTLAIYQYGAIQSPQIWFTDTPCEAGKRYEFFAYLASHRCNARVRIEWYNAAFTAQVGYHDTIETVLNAGGGSALSSYMKIASFAIAPNNAAVARFCFFKWATIPGNGDSWAWCTHPYFGVASTAQTVPSEYTPSGVGTLIGPEGIVTNSLSAISATIGTLRTASSGARMELSDNVLKVFDASGVLRVQLGNLAL